jgi:hypothetical protein
VGQPLIGTHKILLVSKNLPQHPLQISCQNTCQRNSPVGKVKLSALTKSQSVSLLPYGIEARRRQI